MKLLLSILSFTTIAVATTTAQTQPNVQSFPLQDVRLLVSPLKQAQETDKTYILAFAPHRFFSPYLLAEALPL